MSQKTSDTSVGVSGGAYGGASVSEMTAPAKAMNLETFINTFVEGPLHELCAVDARGPSVLVSGTSMRAYAQGQAASFENGEDFMAGTLTVVVEGVHVSPPAGAEITLAFDAGTLYGRTWRWNHNAAALFVEVTGAALRPFCAQPPASVVPTQKERQNAPS